MSSLSFAVGDATQPTQPGPKIIAHVCNDIGGWGKGFVTALSRRWTTPEQRYRTWRRSGQDFGLGQVQLVAVAPGLSVANMVAQHGYQSLHNPVPLDYVALEQCLLILTREAQHRTASVHMPRIGCGLAGGQWKAVEPLIRRTLVAAGVTTIIYDLYPDR